MADPFAPSTDPDIPTPKREDLLPHVHGSVRDMLAADKLDAVQAANEWAGARRIWDERHKEAAINRREQLQAPKDDPLQEPPKEVQDIQLRSEDNLRAPAEDPDNALGVTRRLTREIGGQKAPRQPLDVFLCHSSDDKSAVRDLYQRLIEDGVRPWLDEEDLLPGQDWNMEIRRAVRNSHVVIVCLSERSITKAGYVQKEIRDALDVADEQPEGTIFIIPLRLEECDVPERLRRLHWVDYFEPNGHERLIRALRNRAETLGIELVSTRRDFAVPQNEKRNSLTLIGVEHGNLYLDDKDTFWEIQRGKNVTPFYSAILRFSNEPVPGAAGRTFNRLRARLVFSPIVGGQHAPVDRAYWVREEYNEIDLPVGDSGGLIIAIGVPPGKLGTPLTGFTVSNNHYRGERYNEPVFTRLTEPKYTVSVRIISGEAGTIRFDGTFRVQTQPHLLLTDTEE